MKKFHLLSWVLLLLTSTAWAQDHTATLAKLQAQYPDYYANGVFLVDASEQQMYWYYDGELIRSYTISTAAKGLGSQAESIDILPSLKEGDSYCIQLDS
jgi:hypothetical protein